MALSVRESILAAFYTNLQTADPDNIGAITFFRNRTKELHQRHWPALVMRDGGHEVDEQSHGLAVVSMNVYVDAYIVVADDEDIGPAISDMHAGVIRTVMADRTLGGLATDIFEQELSDPDLVETEGTKPGASFTMQLEIKYCVDPNDPYTAL